MIRKIEVERFTLNSSKPFDQVVAALNSGVGHPDMAEFWKSTHRAQSDAELQNTIEKGLGPTGLMLFVEFDHGAVVRSGTGRATPKMIRFVIGNPLIVRQMVQQVPDATNSHFFDAASFAHCQNFSAAGLSRPFARTMPWMVWQEASPEE